MFSSVNLQDGSIGDETKSFGGWDAVSDNRSEDASLEISIEAKRANSKPHRPVRFLCAAAAFGAYVWSKYINSNDDSIEAFTRRLLATMNSNHEAYYLYAYAFEENIGRQLTKEQSKTEACKYMRWRFEKRKDKPSFAVALGEALVLCENIDLPVESAHQRYYVDLEDAEFIESFRRTVRRFLEANDGAAVPNELMCLEEPTLKHYYDIERRDHMHAKASRLTRNFDNLCERLGRGIPSVSVVESIVGGAVAKRYFECIERCETNKADHHRLDVDSALHNGLRRGRKWLRHEVNQLVELLGVYVRYITLCDNAAEADRLYAEWIRQRNSLNAQRQTKLQHRRQRFKQTATELGVWRIYPNDRLRWMRRFAEDSSMHCWHLFEQLMFHDLVQRLPRGVFQFIPKYRFTERRYTEMCDTNLPKLLQWSRRQQASPMESSATTECDENE